MIVLAGALLEQAKHFWTEESTLSGLLMVLTARVPLPWNSLIAISDRVEFSLEATENLIKTAKTSLGSKMYVLIIGASSQFLLTLR